MNRNIKIKIVGILAAVIAASMIFAADVEVLYVEGYLDVKDGGEWYEVYIGDMLRPDDTIKLDKNSYAELMAGDVKINLTQPGTYTISSLLSASGEIQQSGIGNMITGKFKNMFEETAKGPSTVGGVRAAEVETPSDSISWMGSEAEEMIKAGKKLLSEGNYEEAFLTFEEGYDFAMDIEEENSLLFYMGYTKAMIGELNKALEYLGRVDPDPMMENYGELYIMRGQLLVQSFAYEKAIEWLGSFQSTDAKTADTQTVYILQALAHKALGNTGEAKSILRESVALAPDSEEGEAARKLMNQL